MSLHRIPLFYEWKSMMHFYCNWQYAGSCITNM